MLTGWGITLDLVERYARLLNEDTGGDPVSWYSDRFGEDPDYSSLIAELAPSEDDRQQLLSSYFEPDETDRVQGLKVPTAAHHSLARLVAAGFVKVIVTTNFDRLIESAVREVGVEPSVISSADHARGALPLALGECTVVKLHGDYLSTDLRNTSDELSAYPTTMNRLVRGVFSEYGLVVCGWSGGSDAALRKALLRSPNRRFSTYWMHRGALSPFADDLISHRRAIPVAIVDADSGLDALSERVLALAESAEPDPQDTEAAVKLLKRFMSDSTHRIRLHDLVVGEAERIIDRVADFSVSADQELHEYGQRVRNCEECSARLMTLLATGAFFSSDEWHDQTLERAVNLLATHRVPPRSNGSHPRLRMYPTLLSMYALAIGAAAADRIDPVARVLGNVRIEDRNKLTPISLTASSTRVLNAGMLAGVFPELHRPATAISERLYRVLRSATSDLIRDELRFETLFDEAEYLLGIACAAQITPHEGPVGKGAGSYPPERDLPDRMVRRHSRALIALGVFIDQAALEQCRDAYDGQYQKKYWEL